MLSSEIFVTFRFFVKLVLLCFENLDVNDLVMSVIVRQQSTIKRQVFRYKHSGNVTRKGWVSDELSVNFP